MPIGSAGPATSLARRAAALLLVPPGVAFHLLARLRRRRDRDVGGLGKGGVACLFVDGKKVGEGKVAATAAMIFSADDGCDVGVDNGSPVSPDYGARGNEFSGKVKGVQLAIAADAENLDHLVVPEDAVRIAMARQ